MSKLNEHWVLVPAAPTTSQIINGSLATAFVTHKGAVAVYRAMLSAAPPPPSEEAAKAEPAPAVRVDETAEGISSALVELRAITEDPKYTSNVVSKYDRQCIEAAIGILSALEPVPAQEPHPIHASDCALHNGPATEPGPCDCGADPSMTPERYGSERPAQEPRGCPTPGVCSCGQPEPDEDPGEKGVAWMVGAGDRAEWSVHKRLTDALDVAIGCGGEIHPLFTRPSDAFERGALEEAAKDIDPDGFAVRIIAQAFGTHIEGHGWTGFGPSAEVIAEALGAAIRALPEDKEG